MNTIQWQVEILSPPKVLRHCKKCGTKTQYASSGLFRVNANQKSLDIWLIYRCSRCKSTWNATIFSRINPKSLPKELLQRFSDNDAELALQYASDCELMKHLGVETSPHEYCVSGCDITPGEVARIDIRCQEHTGIRLAHILREKMGVSRSILDKMVLQHNIYLENGAKIRNYKIGANTTVFINNKKPPEN